MEHMRILHICPTSRIEAPLAPESLQYLGHQIERRALDQLHSAEPDSITADVVVTDACIDLSLAPAIAELTAQKGIGAPIIVVLSEGGLATVSAKWNVFDIILTTAGPAEVESRLRLARDRHRASSSPGARSAAHSAASRRGDAGVASSGAADSRSAAWTDAASFSGGGWWTGNGPLTSQGEPMIVVSGALRIDETAFTAHLGARSLDLTYREFALLKFFAMHPERVFTRDEILLGVWGDDYYGGTRTVDVHVRRVRAKLGKDLENAIHTVRNVGYRFSPDSAAKNSDGLEPDADTGSEPEPSEQTEVGEQSEVSAPSEVGAPSEANSPSEVEPNEEDVKI